MLTFFGVKPFFISVRLPFFPFNQDERPETAPFRTPPGGKMASETDKRLSDPDDNKNFTRFFDLFWQKNCYAGTPQKSKDAKEKKWVVEVYKRMVAKCIMFALVRSRWQLPHKRTIYVPNRLAIPFISRHPKFYQADAVIIRSTRFQKSGKGAQMNLIPYLQPVNRFYLPLSRELFDNQRSFCRKQPVWCCDRAGKHVSLGGKGNQGFCSRIFIWKRAFIYSLI